MLSNIEAHPNWPGFNDVFYHPPVRLASRSPIWSSDMTPVDIKAQWRKVWTSAPVVNQSLVPDPTIRQPGFDLPRHTWSMLNCFRTGRGTCRADLHQWGLSTSESCSCEQKQTMSHIDDSCPLSRFECGLQQLHTADDRAVHWLETAAKKALAKWKKNHSFVTVFSRWCNSQRYVKTRYVTALHYSALIFHTVHKFFYATILQNIFNLRMHLIIPNNFPHMHI